MGRVGNVGLAVEVLALIVILKLQPSRLLNHLGSPEQVQTLDFKRLLEVDIVLPVQAAGLNLGLAVDGDLERLVIDEPDVEGAESVHVGDVDLLAHVDLLVLGGGGGGELEGSEGLVALEVLEVHLADEAINIGVDAAIGCDGGVDLHEEGIGLRLEDVDALNVELGGVDLILRDVGDADKDAGPQVRGEGHASSGQDGTYTRQTTRTTMQQKAMRYAHQNFLQ